MHPTTARIFNYLIKYKTAHDGNSPSLREIANAVGLKSTSTVDMHLDELQMQGKLTRKKSDARAIEIVGGAWLAPVERIE